MEVQPFPSTSAATLDSPQNLLPPTPSFIRAPSWRAKHLLDPPEAPPQDTREAELQALAAQEKLGHDGKRQRIRARRTVDPFGGLERWKIFRTTQTSVDDQLWMRTNPSYLINLLPPEAYDNASTSFCSRYAHTSTNKIRCPVNIVKFTPDARRILTGSTSGEFTLWNGLTFNFETILQAHDTAVRCMDWSPSGAWLVSADNSGVIKYFQSNMNNLQAFQGHKESVRDITWSPDDSRFATGADDSTIKLWNFELMKEERTLTGHGWDVKCVKWHPTKGLIVSGGKDNLVKFWDPRTGQALSTLHEHKNTVQACEWNPNGNLVATASRDQTVKVFDIRAMKELVTLRGHKKEVCSLAWHPIHSDNLVSGGSEGSIIHWSMPDAAPKDVLEFAHDSNVWSLAFHPLGHILCSASNDHTTRFWSRGRPGLSIAKDRFHLGRDAVGVQGGEIEDDRDDVLPGLRSSRALPGLNGPPMGGMNGRSDQRPDLRQPSYNQQPQQGGGGLPGLLSGGGGGGGGFAIPGFGGGQPAQGPNVMGIDGGGQVQGRRTGPLPSQMDALRGNAGGYQGGGGGGGYQNRGGGGGGRYDRR